MLMTGLFQPGGMRSISQVIGGLIGFLTLIKVFGVYVDVNEIGYRHNKGAIIITRHRWVFRRLGMLRWPVRSRVTPYFRTYHKGWYFKIPVFWDITIGTKADETRVIESFEVDGPDGVQKTVVSSVTYRVRPYAPDLYRSRQYAQLLDSTVIQVVKAALSRVVSEYDLRAIDVKQLTALVRLECEKTLRKYGQELVRVDMPLPARSHAQVLNEGMARGSDPATVLAVVGERNTG